MAKPKSFKRILGIDFETANRSRASACSVGLYLKDVATASVLYEKEILIDPECDFDHFNMLIHGITPETVKGQPTFKEAYTVIDSLIDDDTVVVAHNAAFDMSVFRRSCDRYSLSYPNIKYVCTLLLSKAMIKNLSSYALNDLSNSLDLGFFNHHHALDDARMCVLLFEKLSSSCEAVSLYQLANRTGVRFGYLYSDGYKPCSVRKESAHLIDSVNDDSDPYEDNGFEVDENNPLYQKIVVFTGALSGMPRKDAEREVLRHGGIPAANITKATNYLVFGYQDPKVLNGKEKSSKRIKAEKMASEGYDIQIITEDDFYHLLEE